MMGRYLSSIAVVVAGLCMLLTARHSLASCCSCSCVTPGDFCVDVAEDECTDACGNQTPSCGFFSFSATAVCTAHGCVAPTSSSAPAVSSRNTLLIAVGFLGLGVWSIRRYRDS